MMLGDEGQSEPAGWAVAAVVLGLISRLGLEPRLRCAAALAALWSGAFGSWYAFTSATLVRSVPLILIGLGIAIAFRAGVFNIGAEGQFYAGAIAATWVGLHVGSSSARLRSPRCCLSRPRWPAPPGWPYRSGSSSASASSR